MIRELVGRVVQPLSKQTHLIATRCQGFVQDIALTTVGHKPRFSRMKGDKSDPGESSSTEPRHPIPVVAERTGLTQDVIRVWERRYRAVEPARGNGGQRLYTDADVERLRLLSRASSAGRSIGQIASLSTIELARIVDEDVASRNARYSSSVEPIDRGETIDRALGYARSLASTALEDHLRRASARLGMTAFIEGVAAPFLRKVGDEWHAGRLTAAQEHLASSILQDILVAQMRSFPARDGAPRVLVATAAGERHGIGALSVGAAAALHGWNVLYLGVDLPAEEIVRAAIAAEVAMVAVSIVYVDDRQRVLGEMRALRAGLPETITFVVGGSGAVLLWRELSGGGIRVEAKLDHIFGAVRPQSA
jgi:DNA-binding transcriptional MerR regulator/methylmalonyl-CoA mutase cobalamin-binding subunit